MCAFLYEGKKKKLTWAASNLEMALFTSDLFQKVKDEPHPQVRPKTSRVCWGSLGICWLQIRLTILRGCSEEQLALPTGNKPGLHWPWGNCLLPYLRNGVNDTYFLREKKKNQSEHKCQLSFQDCHLSPSHIFWGLLWRLWHRGKREQRNEGPDNLVCALLCCSSALQPGGNSLWSWVNFYICKMVTILYSSWAR